MMAKLSYTVVLTLKDVPSDVQQDNYDLVIRNAVQALLKEGYVPKLLDVDVFNRSRTRL